MKIKIAKCAIRRRMVGSVRIRQNALKKLVMTKYHLCHRSIGRVVESAAVGLAQAVGENRGMPGGYYIILRRRRRLIKKLMQNCRLVAWHGRKCAYEW
jgi:hypothetical protein